MKDFVMDVVRVGEINGCVYLNSEDVGYKCGIGILCYILVYVCIRNVI